MNAEDKKLQHIVGSLISKYRKTNDPYWVELIELYLKFLDERVYGFIKNLSNMYDTEKTDSVFVDALYDQYANSLVAHEVIETNEELKRFYTSYAKLINNLKATKISIEFLFRYLADGTYHFSDGSSKKIENIGINVLESEDYGKFKYKYSSTQELMPKDFINIVKSVHPAGFQFFKDAGVSTESSIDLLVDVSLRYLVAEMNRYKAFHGENGVNTESKYNGTLQYIPVVVTA